jgi:hypothetical protein
MMNLAKRPRQSHKLFLAQTAAVLCSLCWIAPAGAQEHHLAENEIAIFVGIAQEGRDDGLAVGVEYERRIDESLGLGLLVEHTFGDINTWVFAVPLTLHVDEWKFVLAPGIEDRDGHSENLVRIAVGYGFETSKVKMTPTFNVDFVDDETIFVLGVAFGWPF